MRVGEYLVTGGSGLQEDERKTGEQRTRELSEASIEADVLRRIGLSEPLIAEMAARATKTGATLEEELLSCGAMSECEYYAAIANLLCLPYLPEIDHRQIIDTDTLDAQLRRPCLLRLQRPHRSLLTVIVPEARRLPVLIDMLAKGPRLRTDMLVTSACETRRAVWQAGESRRVRGAVNRLFDQQPRLSARIVVWGRQGFVAGLSAALLAISLLLVPGPSLHLLHACLSMFYLAAFLLKCCPILFRPKHGLPNLPLPPPVDLPVYTVLVALYREAEVAPQLMTALNRLNWPPSRLDIKLICEADDPDTIAALRAFNPGPHFEIIEVPPMPPRTKPKALTYALAAAKGDYIAIYDAEDRPHPDQLLEAYGAFSRASPEIACLQAPLIVTNAHHSWISALFSLEYSALFRGLLPLLARYTMPLPLGGTSNHFRADVLRAVGAWDPFNVTEDADLGMRMYRVGYRSGVLRRQTLEDAPTSAKIWLNQRTRWFKGWLQTWLVLMRFPRNLCREMGMPAFIVFNLLIGGMLLSSLSHPFILLFIGMTFAKMLQADGDGATLGVRILFVFDCINIFGSYLAVLGVGRWAMIRHEKKRIGWRWCALPLYWMMVSLAAWRAVLELYSNPFLWRKTPHKPMQRNAKSRKDSP